MTKDELILGHKVTSIEEILENGEYSGLDGVKLAPPSD